MPDLRLVEGCVSNSRPLPKSWNGAGVDTVRFRYRGDVDGHAQFARSGSRWRGARQSAVRLSGRRVEGGLGRLDVAAELRFEDGADGLAFLHALSLADVPWAKVGTEGKKRERIQTVNFRSVRGRTILMRTYDKGIESGLASPGELVRFER